MEKQREWLAAIRADRTHQEMAKIVGVSRPYYTQIECGSKNPGVKVAQKIAKALGVDWTLFFDERCCDSHHI